MSFGSRSLPPPTADEVRRWAAIKEGEKCAATGQRGPVEIHHLLSDGGLRLGHRYTVGLAPSVHRIVKTRAFKQVWSNQHLLCKQDSEIDWPWVEIPARRDRARHKPTRRKGSKRGTHTKTPDKCRIGWTPNDRA